MQEVSEKYSSASLVSRLLKLIPTVFCLLSLRAFCSIFVVANGLPSTTAVSWCDVRSSPNGYRFSDQECRLLCLHFLSDVLTRGEQVPDAAVCRLSLSVEQAELGGNRPSSLSPFQRCVIDNRLDDVGCTPLVSAALTDSQLRGVVGQRGACVGAGCSRPDVQLAAVAGVSTIPGDGEYPAKVERRVDVAKNSPLLAPQGSKSSLAGGATIELQSVPGPYGQFWGCEYISCGVGCTSTAKQCLSLCGDFVRNDTFPVEGRNQCWPYSSTHLMGCIEHHLETDGCKFLPKETPTSIPPTTEPTSSATGEEEFPTGLVVGVAAGSIVAVAASAVAAWKFYPRKGELDTELDRVENYFEQSVDCPTRATVFHYDYD